MVYVSALSFLYRKSCAIQEPSIIIIIIIICRDVESGENGIVDYDATYPSGSDSRCAILAPLSVLNKIISLFFFFS